MYVSPNFKTKKAFKEAVKKANETGVGFPEVFSPGPFPAPTKGETSVEGPHYPAPHTWYARVLVSDGKVAKVLS